MKKIKYLTSYEYAQLGTKQFLIGRAIDAVFDLASGVSILVVGILGSYALFSIAIANHLI